MFDHSNMLQFLHADMAFTLAKRIFDQSHSSSLPTGISVADFEYHEPVVKRQNTSEAQPIVIAAEADLTKNEVHIKWYNPSKELWYCHATVYYEDPTSWLSRWSLSSKLVTSRIETLNDMAAAGKANKVTTDLAYSLFGKLVEYSAMYRTMQNVILNDDEAVAEVVFPQDTTGNWTVPPHFIDGCVSLSGFILNGGTYFDNTNNFFITPSWKSMRFAKPLAPGGRYLAYVRMVPIDGHSFAGDVYILQGTEIVGVVEAIVFRQWPRVMLNRFFRPPDAATKTATKLPIFTPPTPSESSDDSAESLQNGQDLQTGGTPQINTRLSLPEPPAKPQANENISRALVLLAEELAVDIGLLTDEAQIADLGLDSLMSLVVSQRLREELGIEIRDAFFLEVTTIGELKNLLH